MYDQAWELGRQQALLVKTADRLIATHVQPPQMPLPFEEYGSSQEEQDHWMRGK